MSSGGGRGRARARTAPGARSARTGLAGLEPEARPAVSGARPRQDVTALEPPGVPPRTRASRAPRPAAAASTSARPQVETPLLALAVGVERAVEPPSGSDLPSSHPRSPATRRSAPVRCAGSPRRSPAATGRCRRASSRSGARPTSRRRCSARSRRRAGRGCRRRPWRRAWCRHGQGAFPPPQQKTQAPCGGNLGAPPKPPWSGRRPPGREGLGLHPGGGLPLGAAVGEGALEPLHPAYLRRGLLHLVAALPPRRAQPLQHLRNDGCPQRGGREVGASEERRPSGVATTVSGHPRAGHACTALM